MSKKPSLPTLSRRDFLTLLGVAGVTAAGGYTLYTYAPWLDVDARASEIRRPFEKDVTVSTQMRELVRYATLAASGHNTQPWQFTITETENVIDIHPDYTRHLAAVDPTDRELWISLGCALENLLIAARGSGYAASVTYPGANDFIRIELTTDRPQTNKLFDAIPLRQNTRSEYDGQLIKTADFDQVQAVGLEPGVVLHFVTNPNELETVLEYVNQGNLSQYADKEFVNELLHWLRFTKKEALASRDGLYTAASGNPQVPRWLGQMVVSNAKPQQQADTDAKKLRSSSGAVVVASESEDKTAWVRTGQVYERLALTMTALNIKSAFLNQPIEVADVRRQFQSAIKLGNALPQLLVRFGYADGLPPSLRRPVEDVLLQA
jgi:hypothetical protein